MGSRATGSQSTPFVSTDFAVILVHMHIGYTTLDRVFMPEVSFAAVPYF